MVRSRYLNVWLKSPTEITKDVTVLFSALKLYLVVSTDSLQFFTASLGGIDDDNPENTRPTTFNQTN